MDNYLNSLKFMDSQPSLTIVDSTSDEYTYRQMNDDDGHDDDHDDDDYDDYDDYDEYDEYDEYLYSS